MKESAPTLASGPVPPPAAGCCSGGGWVPDQENAENAPSRGHTITNPPRLLWEFGAPEGIGGSYYRKGQKKIRCQIGSGDFNRTNDTPDQ